MNRIIITVESRCRPGAGGGKRDVPKIKSAFLFLVKTLVLMCKAQENIVPLVGNDENMK